MKHNKSIFDIGDVVKVNFDGIFVSGKILSIDGNLIKVNVNENCDVTSHKKHVSKIEKEFEYKEGDLVYYFEDGNWYSGVFTGYSKNCVGRKLLNVKDAYGSELVFYSHEVKIRLV